MDGAKLMASTIAPTGSRLRDIKTFPSLVKYLRDDLEWPIESDDFEDVTFDWEPEELGIDPENAAKIQEIKQLRPLADRQPWGIFFVKFEPRKLPVVALRRILRALVIRKRGSAKKAQQKSWELHDLLFISLYGSSEHREIAFAHFAEEPDLGDLPTLRVLGWDDENTPLHLDHADRELREKLKWSDDVDDLEEWRRRWSSAFTLRHGEVIRTAKAMAERLAELAGKIRKRVNAVLRIESDKGPLRHLHKSFREALIHDLSEDDFADMYAQTISYGLLTARISRPAGIIGDNLRDMVPVTNPFLRDLLETFLTVGGRKGKIEFDELGVSEVVQMLRDADMEAVLRDFGDRNPQEDPAIHFYVLFLKEYDPEKRVKRGVFYTPRPVVSYIVRSVHELLQSEFGLPEGLASTATWGDMAKRHTGLRLPEGTAADTPFVQILDPAVGTGTFLVEVIDIVHRTMLAKWGKERRLELEIPKLWNEYVSKQLLPRLHGYELMMAPYAIAHMKIGLKLYETGYRFGSDERARIYLTNSLEPPHDFADRLAFDAPALAHEAKAVNAIKRQQRFTVVIGNPPYSKVSANISEDEHGTPTFIGNLITDYKFVDGKPLDERNSKWLQDDYVKFIRFAQWSLSNTGIGIIGFITNHGYLDNPTFRGLRRSLLKSLGDIYIYDLHGNSRKKEEAPDGSEEQNVFDIQQGVAILLGLRQKETFEEHAYAMQTYGVSLKASSKDLWNLICL
jgi:predicted helicase